MIKIKDLCVLEGEAQHSISESEQGLSLGSRKQIIFNFSKLRYFADFLQETLLCKSGNALFKLVISFSPGQAAAMCDGDFGLTLLTKMLRCGRCEVSALASPGGSPLLRSGLRVSLRGGLALSPPTPRSWPPCCDHPPSTLISCS